MSKKSKRPARSRSRKTATRAKSTATQRLVIIRGVRCDRRTRKPL